MREISQKIFHIFKTQYIDNNRNIFAEISVLGIEQLAGQYKNYIETQVASGILESDELEKRIDIHKSTVISFISYQLGNNIISNGVGCGYYDPTGKEDKHLIGVLMNDYFFNQCFNPVSNENIEYFLDYLLRNFASVFASTREDGRNYIPTINEFTKVLDKKKLIMYWKINSSDIKALKLEDKEKILNVGNYTASYKRDLPLIYKVLDDHLLIENERLVSVEKLRNTLQELVDSKVKETNT
jgi:hypothetical protein